MSTIEQQKSPVLRGALAIKRLKGMPDVTCLEIGGLRFSIFQRYKLINGYLRVQG